MIVSVKGHIKITWARFTNGSHLFFRLNAISEGKRKGYFVKDFLAITE